MIYFDLMALDQQERDRRQRALQEAGRIGLQAYLGSQEQNRADALANLKMGQDANNQALIRSTLEGRGATWADDSVARANERPQLDQQMRQVATEPSVAQQPIQSPMVRKQVQNVPVQDQSQLLAEQQRQASTYMDAARREEQLPYWKNATPQQKEAALGVIAKRITPAQTQPVRASMPEMQQVKLDNPRQAAQRTGLPVKEIVTVRNSVRRSGIRGADSSEYVNNFEDTASIVFDPKASYQDKLTEVGRYLAKDKQIREFYGDQPASNEMLKILMGGLGGGGKGGAGGKMDYWSKGKRTIGLPRGMTPADFPETYSKFGGLGNEDWDLTSATPALTRQKEKADIMKKIKDVEGDTSALEAQLDALNYGNPTKPKLVATPNWNNSMFYSGFGNQQQPSVPSAKTTKEEQPQEGIAYRRPGMKGLWKYQDGEWMQVTERVRGFR